MTIKLTERDYKVLDFIKEYKCADTDTLTKLFFVSKATCEKRLRKLVECNKLNRYRANILEPYIYYKGSKPTNIKHTLAISQVYSVLQSSYQVVKYKREWEIKYLNKVLRTDLMVVIKLNGKLIPIIVECDLTKAYDYKYDDFINRGYYTKYFPLPPIIVVISNRTPRSSGKVVHIKLDEIKNMEIFRK